MTGAIILKIAVSDSRTPLLLSLQQRSGREHCFARLYRRVSESLNYKLRPKYR